jgi:hypothetical protein
MLVKNEVLQLQGPLDRDCEGNSGHDLLHDAYMTNARPLPVPHIMHNPLDGSDNLNSLGLASSGQAHCLL